MEEDKEKKVSKAKKALKKLFDHPASTPDKVKVKWAPILIVGFFSLFLMVASYFFGLKFVGKENYTGFIDWLSNNFGLKLGIFLYTYILDTLILPLSPDLVWVVGAGMNPWESVLIVGCASMLGGFTAYGIGYLVDKIPPIKRFTNKINDKWSAYIKAYGVPFLLMAAVLPLPFSTICMVAGLVHLGPRKAFPPCLLRFVHALLYYLIFRAGFLLV